MNEMLLLTPTEDEIQQALFQMQPTKAQGPNGMPPLFFQRYWDLVKNDVIQLVLLRMDKSWLHCDRTGEAYRKGVRQFLDFAFANAAQGGQILCPCVNCNNCVWKNRNDVYKDMIVKGIDPTYDDWRYHGECFSSSDAEFTKSGEDMPYLGDDIERMLYDTHPYILEHLEGGDHIDNDNVPEEIHDTDMERLQQLLEDCKQELYPGAPLSKLNFIVRMFLAKCLHGVTNAGFTAFLEILNLSFPEVKTIPKNFNETRSIMRGLGLGYNKIDVCKNDCMLFWKENVDAEFCHTCGASRWVTNDDINSENGIYRNKSSTISEQGTSPIGKKIPHKVLRHFPLQTRIQRLFMCSKTATSMRWHEGRTKDGKLRHPADSESWSALDSFDPNFASDSRNVRLGLASDGFNPFRTMSISYSMWPVVLIPYNLPPWMCMKPPNFIMSLLIPGKESPGNNIDVYLQPLIDELKELWDVGIKTYDASKCAYFQMRAALLWTINDFPAYAMLSGWSTKGRLACPVCCYSTKSIYLKNSRKFCYPGHRRFVHSEHEWRFDTRSFYDGKELDPPPALLSGSDILQHLVGMENKFGKTKNVCDNVLGTLLDMQGKSKDHLKGRRDLEEIGVRHELHPTESESNKIYLPPASFSMGVKEKNNFCKVLKGVRIPDGYASNISRCVQLMGHKIFGLKSHDCHFILHYLIQIAVRRALPRNVAEPLIKLGDFFRCLCAKVIDLDELDKLESEIAETLCRLEIIFPPSFFDIMMHLPIHLAHEVRVGGPVQFRWMYPIERYLGVLKSYVRNRSRPEGSIAEGYIAEECLTFCSRYLNEEADTRFNRPSRNFDNVNNEIQGSSAVTRLGRPLGNGEMFTLTETTWIQAHRYVLFNNDTINPYREEHREIMESQRHRNRSREWDTAFGHSKEFHEWFEVRVREEQVSEEIKWLSRGPNYAGRRFKGYIINGFRFRTLDRDMGKKTQNCGVCVTASTPSFASNKDQNPIVADITYYGVVKEIIEIDYYGYQSFVLFECDWFYWKNDEFNLPMINSKKLIYKSDPFVIATQVHQVFYVQDPVQPDWYSVIKVLPRDNYDLHDESHTCDTDTDWLGESSRSILDDTMIAGEENA
ncbi:uncharacterized protein LOC120009878 [Tripterygium wilfordii]|uniref:uncharacterized protein LOC120009878 n=1 Tax=Tripterygium wilfordii TaxID=458696 RepID=UPI0018F86432|nr:uncharacterized protein LOC120009878 [Tripterygium wilfordii]